MSLTGPSGGRKPIKEFIDKIDAANEKSEKVEVIERIKDDLFDLLNDETAI